jgi:hypothetical protein
MGELNLFRSSFKGLAILLAAGAATAAFSQHHVKKSSGAGIKCTLAEVRDSQRSSLVAYTFFLPDGWKNQSALNWSGNTFTASFNRSSPDGRYIVISGMPSNMRYNAVTNGTPSGTKFSKASDYLHTIVDNLSRSGKVTNVQVQEEYDKDLPLEPTQISQQQGRQIPSYTVSQIHQTAFLKISFELDGKPETASMGTTMVGSLGLNHIAMGGPTFLQPNRPKTSFDTENDFYIVGPTLVVITPAQPTPSKLREVQLIASSTSMTPQFATFCLKLALAESDAGLKAMAQRGRQLIQDMREQSEKNLVDFKRQMADRDATTHDFCNFISDQQDYKNSSGSIYTLPAYYSHAWTNDEGDFLLTDDPTVDPRGSGGTWEEMSKAHHGQ